MILISLPQRGRWQPKADVMNSLLRKGIGVCTAQQTRLEKHY